MTLDIEEQTITKDVGVAVTQGSATGTLKIALAGATTSVVIQTASGVSPLPPNKPPIAFIGDP